MCHLRGFTWQKRTLCTCIWDLFICCRHGLSGLLCSLFNLLGFHLSNRNISALVLCLKVCCEVNCEVTYGSVFCSIFPWILPLGPQIYWYNISVPLLWWLHIGVPVPVDLQQLFLGHDSMAVAVTAMWMCVFSIKPHRWRNGGRGKKSQKQKTSRKVHFSWYPQETVIWKSF